MTGAAGGLSGGLWAALGAKLVPGAAYVLDAVGFDAAMRGARYVVTGEGRIDEQTLTGKLVGEVATRCRQGGVGCHALVGQDALDLFGAARARPGLRARGDDARGARAGGARAGGGAGVRFAGASATTIRPWRDRTTSPLRIGRSRAAIPTPSLWVPVRHQSAAASGARFG